MHKFLRVSLILLAAVLPLAVLAQGDGNNQPVYGLFSLSVSEEMDVENDQMTVRLQAQAQGPDSAALANKINATMSWASARLRTFTSIKSKTLDYQTYPRYERNTSKIIGWNANQSLQLETDNFEDAGKAIQVLQERLQVNGIQLSPKPATRKAAEDILINKALDAFKQRAQIVQLNMGAPSYRMLDVSIDTAGSMTPYNDGARYSTKTRSLSVESAPAIEAGTSSVSVRIYGRIELD